ncbi:hypothetical protein FGRA07_11496 [Fusarium graminearum]|nr:hypothetical protein FGRA07_11496 [Fusarium graminearum]
MATLLEEPPLYEAGAVLQLRIVKRNARFIPMSGTISVQVDSVFSQTMSPVMRISFDNRNATLKVYDRRVGSQFRRIHDVIPYNEQGRTAFHDFIRSGAVGPFLKELDDEEADPDLYFDRRDARDVREEENGIAKFEAALWRNANRNFKTEVEAYERLQDVQGIFAPRLYAVVRLHLPLDDNAAMADYLGVYGIILQSISGPTLEDLLETPCALSTQEHLTSIVQYRVDATNEINKRGMVLEDRAPRNVVLEKSLQWWPFIIDLAQCLFKDTVFECQAAQARVEGDESQDLDEEFNELARMMDNAGNVGRPLQRQIRKGFGFDLNIMYPDVDELLRTGAPMKYKCYGYDAFFEPPCDARREDWKSVVSSW